MMPRKIITVHHMAKKARFACLFYGGKGGRRTRLPGNIGDSGATECVHAVPPEGIRKILIIDDESLVRDSLRVLLEHMDCSVIEAGDGAAGIRQCQEAQPDMVLLDIAMPILDGFEVCRRLKAEPGIADIPVIFISGLDQVKDRIQAFQVGAVDYVTKPFNFDEVQARVGVHLALLQQRRQMERQNLALQRAFYKLEQANRRLIEANERLRESESLKSHFIAHMRNEINNPFNSIMALSQELRDLRIPREKHIQVSGLILAEASHLDFQFKNIICAAELEAGNAQPRFSRVDIPSVLRDTVDSFVHSEPEWKRNLRMECVKELSEAFLTDAGKFQQIAANLLSNAVKFNREGGLVCLRAFLSQENSGQKNLVLEIEDEGPGIQEQDQGRIFEHFTQLDTGLGRRYRGQGLGLSVVKALADLLGGSISVCNTAGGCLFRLVLPPGSPLQDSSVSAMDGNLFFFDGVDES